jgi:glutaredoxin
MDASHGPITITLLTQRHCTYCDQAKEILGRLAADFPIAVSTLDLASPEGQVLAESNGVLFPPGIFLDGVAFSYGRPSEKKLRRELERRVGQGRHE